MKKIGQRRFFVIVVLAVTVILVLVAPFLVQWRYTAILNEGQEYQWPVSISRSNSWVPTDYLDVTFLGCRAPWKGPVAPSPGSEIYVTLQTRPSGILYPVSAGAVQPSSGLYVLAKVTRFEQGYVEFTLPFNRVKVDVSKVKPQFYQNYKGILMATVKIRNGRGVVTGVYSKGIALENAVPEDSKQQEEDSRVPIDEIGMTPDMVRATRN